ncbi:putative FK506-binding protein (FKBP)-type peptidyl-prolyl isomerase [Trypanosoma cruzi]|uniref:peptidylprolyl isomerase n=3 Tax=Trypanosoma cruzi TaxID=5693 RepID=Q4CZN2_TRYCC|nr:peptidylprolyl isomerase-like, putative [Trypanosoma cruzi]EAN85727.1 peptidylprolyl isomerase-like, putative [Trypanosoma cruzi]KAF8292575.1 putative FK506-binding protein (FKBP)-type peptidyl-prolyl isomerase [Trypanosoma cruzi]PWU99981.1 putative FK506-binding protein (FKBP)-type peptidyl-prolyl isomerase [Trypanosoma cruzi]RNC56647.1 putative peptidylprolyl isomerase-like [Trypanosoma cruzi]|eukprot:XP_807578.1 peptidylprolyl isomerase-like [Trypanosoma cruzi strain CL Brener]
MPVCIYLNLLHFPQEATPLLLTRSAKTSLKMDSMNWEEDSTKSMSSVESQSLRDVEYPIREETEVPGTNEGLFKTVLVAGTGTRPVKGAKVKVHYIGKLEADGSKFDSSFDRGEYFEFTLGSGQVIKGWDKGVATMQIGETAILKCSPAYGYGAAGSPPKIPANATLLFEVTLVDWTREEDISEENDKSIMKNLTVEGVGYEKPGYETTVKIDLRVYRGAKEEGKILCERLGWRLVLGDAAVPPHLEQCLSTMRDRETASFRIAGHRITEPCEEFNIASGEPVTYVVELYGLETVKIWKLEGRERLIECERRRQQGNDAFRAGKLEAAMRKYRRAIEFLETDSGLKDEEKEEARKARVILFGNLSQVLLSRQKFSECVGYCDKVLEKEPQNPKALYRRAKANCLLCEWDEAKRDVEQLLAIDAQNTDAKVLLQQLQEKRRAYEKKQQAIYKKMFTS